MSDFRMSTARRWAAGAYDPQLGLVISGGIGGSGSSSAEKTLDGITFSTLPSMPGSLYEHCLVSLQNGNIFATGRSSTFMYHGSNNTWSSLNDIPTNTYGI